MEGFKDTGEYDLLKKQFRKYIYFCNLDMTTLKNKYPSKSNEYYATKADQILYNNLQLKNTISYKVDDIHEDILDAIKRYLNKEKIRIDKYFKSLNRDTFLSDDVVSFFRVNYTNYYYNSSDDMNTDKITPINKPPLVSIYDDSSHELFNTYKETDLIPQIQALKETL